MKKIPVALQLYSVREDCKTDFPATLKIVKEMGYDGVELAGMHGLNVSDLNAITKDLGLRIYSAHVDRAELKEDPLRSAELYEALGCDFIAYPWSGTDELAGGAGYPDFIETTKKISRSLRVRGIELLYHNHDHELALYEGQTLLDNILFDLGDSIKLELDACWCNVGGYDPCQFLRDHKGKIPVVHFKDYTGSREEGNFAFAPLGQGCLDIADLLVASSECGAELIIVEQDSPSDGMTALECAKASVDYLRELQK
ncbi:sugar phosphate isomerase/epimerase [bacterium]|nr:sugar phosphate isomerase/epimerase [bacterium]